MGEKVIMPVYKIVMAKMLGPIAVWVIEKVPNGTISEHIDDMSHDAE